MIRMKLMQRIFTTCSVLFLFGLNVNAQALEWQCGKTIELRGTPDSTSPEVTRPFLLIAKKVDSEGKEFKRFRPLAATNEAVADFLVSITDTTQVCLKYYDQLSPAPVPLLILDIKHDSQSR